MSQKLSDAEILESWQVNAKPWINAIDNKEIESRQLVTNQAIVDAIINIKPHSVLDIGCGEGWLAASLIEKGIDVFGIDGVPHLIEKARKIKNGEFAICTYEELSSYKFNRKFDCMVCNFSLIGKESTERVIASAKTLLKPGGRFIIQTLHPVIACSDMPYEDGWREGSWAGFSKDFTKPAPWYFRTLESWLRLFSDNELQIKHIAEPINPKTKKPASIVFEVSKSIYAPLLHES